MGDEPNQPPPEGDGEPTPSAYDQQMRDRELAHYERQLATRDRDNRSLRLGLISVGVSIAAVVGMFYFVVGLCS